MPKSIFLDRLFFRNPGQIASLLLCIGLTAHPSTVSAIEQAELRDFTEYAISNELVPFDPPNLDWSKNSVRFSIGGVIRYTPEDSTSLLSIPVADQFRVTGIRMYRNDENQRNFWNPVLGRAENRIATMLALAQRGGVDAKKAIQEESNLMHQEIMDALDALAKMNAKAGVATNKPFSTWKVKISIPAGSTIEFMDAGDWELYYFRRTKLREDILPPNWHSVNHPAEFNRFGGLYYFRVTLPNGVKERARIRISEMDENTTILWSMITKI